VKTIFNITAVISNELMILLIVV